MALAPSSSGTPGAHPSVLYLPGIAALGSPLPCLPLAGCSLPSPCPHAHARMLSRADDEALAAFQLVSRLEGIIPALETSHALAYLDKLCPAVPDGTRIVINCSGRGDKDVTVRQGGARGPLAGTCRGAQGACVPAGQQPRLAWPGRRA